VSHDTVGIAKYGIIREMKRETKNTMCCLLFFVFSFQPLHPTGIVGGGCCRGTPCMHAGGHPTSPSVRASRDGVKRRRRVVQYLSSLHQPNHDIWSVCNLIGHKNTLRGVRADAFQLHGSAIKKSLLPEAARDRSASHSCVRWTEVAPVKAHTRVDR
jgi:hypothetical protein